MKFSLAAFDVRRFCSTGLVSVLVLSGAMASQARADEIIVTIERVTALDQEDALSRPDFLARVTIAGEAFVTPVIRNQNTITPNWVLSKNVPAGTHNVKVEILDQDVTKNDLADINRVDNKRDIDFTVNTRNCRIQGFSSPFRCGSKIVRAGTERRKARVTFSVAVKR
jgi:hypothetical protein